MRRAWVAAALITAACAPVRFVDRGVVWQEHDDAPIPRPATNPLSVDWNSVRDTLFVPLNRALRLDYGVEAQNVNALDEVPDSTWFHDPRREPPSVRPRALSSEEMLWGAVKPDDVPVLPLTAIKTKSVGASEGFIASDARGVRYMIKLDPPGRAGFATAVEVVASRLAWACGWRVPAEVELEVRPADVLAAPGLELPKLSADAGGRVTLLASRWLPGANIGPFRWFGRRRDDANDRFPHEDRRDVRGFGVWSAWVNNIDTLENNTLDMYEGPAGRGHVVHYQQDVGGAFGVWKFQSMQYWMGHESYFDLSHITRSLIGLGFTSGYWEEARFRDGYEARAETSRELAAFDGEHFDPRRWRPTIPNAAFSRLTARDRYWATKRIALVDERELRAAIAAGHYRAAIAEQVFRILWLRRDKVLRAFLADVTPLDYFRFEGDALCFDDVWARSGLGGEVRYNAREGRRRLPERGGDDGVVCVPLERRAGYRVIALGAERAGLPRRAPVRVHLVERDGQRRVVGVER